jgi:hypothetical protein
VLIDLLMRPESWLIADSRQEIVMDRKINCILVFLQISRPNKVYGQGYTSPSRESCRNSPAAVSSKWETRGSGYQVGVIRAKEEIHRVQ